MVYYGNTIRHPEISGMAHHQVITAGQDGVPEVLPTQYSFQFLLLRPESINFQLPYPLGKMKGEVLAPGMCRQYYWVNMSRNSAGNIYI